jgi:hypothetical protein
VNNCYTRVCWRPTISTPRACFLNVAFNRFTLRLYTPIENSPAFEWRFIFLKNGVIWDVTPCWSCKNRRSGGTQRLIHQGDKNRWTRKNFSNNYQPAHATKKNIFYLITLHYTVFLRSMRRLLVTANVVPSSPILSPWWWRHEVPLKRRLLQEPHDATSQKTAFFSHCRKNLKSYIALTGWTL